MYSTIAELKELVEITYQQIKGGLTPELDRLELKRQWYPLNKSAINANQQRSKFLKSLVALANGYGPISAYVIIGLDEKTGQIIDSPFTSSQLKDKSELFDFVFSTTEKHIEFQCFEIETSIDGSPKIVCVLEIPPSLEKPHFIIKYFDKELERDQFIPIKKGTRTLAASKKDIELMIYDRGNLKPKYELSVMSYAGAEGQFKNRIEHMEFRFPFIFENTGRRPIVIVGGFLDYRGDGKMERKPFKMNFVAYTQGNQMPEMIVELNKSPIVIGSDSAFSTICIFSIPLKDLLDRSVYVQVNYFVTFIDVHGNNWNSEPVAVGGKDQIHKTS